MWAYDFMQKALFGGIIVSTVCGIISVFIILRRMSFAAHALGHMGLTGASVATLLGINVIIGQIVLIGCVSVVAGLIGDKIKKNDLSIGVILTFILGIGSYSLFLFQNHYAGSVTAILFGNIFSISTSQIWQLLILALIVIVTMTIITRPLLFFSVDMITAESKNVSKKLLSVVFFLVLAITVSMACQVVGTILVFTLLIIPGAIGVSCGRSFYHILSISIITANISFVTALYSAYYYDLPVSFCLTMILCFLYFISLIKTKFT